MFFLTVASYSYARERRGHKNVITLDPWGSELYPVKTSAINPRLHLNSPGVLKGQEHCNGCRESLSAVRRKKILDVSTDRLLLWNQLFFQISLRDSSRGWPAGLEIWDASVQQFIYPSGYADRAGLTLSSPAWVLHHPLHCQLPACVCRSAIHEAALFRGTGCHQRGPAGEKADSVSSFFFGVCVCMYQKGLLL